MQTLNPGTGFQLDCSFRINNKPFSINAYHYRDKRHKTAEARAWEEEIVYALADVKELSAIADDWRKSGGYFELHITAVYPEYLFYTQSGEISGKTIDVTNFEKPLQDLIFKQMGLNDKLVKKMVSEKSAGTHNYLEVTIRLII